MAVVAAGVLMLSLIGCSGDRAEPPTAAPAVEPTPLDGYVTSGVTLIRSEFCDRVTGEAVMAALGEEPTADRSWLPGTRLPGSSDISNEFGCSWTAGPVRATAWVFAPPVTADRAGDFARESVGKACERLATAPDLGAPSVARHCAHAGLTSVHGLVGDTWVGCEISGRPVPGVDDTARVGEWCVAVLEALRTA
jgi:hypothetical protein